MKYDPINRRMFLQGVGGITLACPVLPSLLPKLAFAQGSGGLDFVVMICHHYGAYDSQYFPDTTGMTPSYVDATQNVKLWNMASVIAKSNIMSATPFVDIASKVSMYQGLDRFGWINHSGNECLTGDRSGGYHGQSIDHFIANKIYSSEPYMRNLAMGPSGGRHDISFYNDGEGNLQRFVSHQYAATAIEYIFSNIGATAAQNEAIKQGNLSIVGSVLADYNSLKNNSRLSGQDKQRLAQHMELIHELETKLKNRGTPLCAKPGEEEFTNASFGSPGHLRDMLVVAKTAITCGLSRVITITHHSNHLHSQSHQNAGPNTKEASKDYHCSVIRPIMTEIANFCKSLDGIDVGGGYTKLDKGMVLITSDMGSTINHVPNSYPVTIVGGKTKISSGKFIDYRNPTASQFNRGRPGQPYNRLLISVMQAMGLTYVDWEDPQGSPGFGSEKYSSHDRQHWDDFFKNYDRRAPLPKFFG